MTENRRKVFGCHCVQPKLHRQQRRKDQCKRKRQTFVYNPEEEIWHEPYLRELRREFSDVSILCDSKIELPWKDIVLPAAGMKIRHELSITPLNDADGQAGDKDVDKDVEDKESLGNMMLPWKDLIVTETVLPRLEETGGCDSTLEIPWSDLVLEKPPDIRPLQEESCGTNDVEIPWNDILIPRNLVIEVQTKKHPSSKYPPRYSGGKNVVCCSESPSSKQRRTTICK